MAQIVKTQQPTRLLSLMKGKEHFCFRYETGSEAKVLDALVDMVHRRDVAFEVVGRHFERHELLLRRRAAVLRRVVEVVLDRQLAAARQGNDARRAVAVR